MGFIPFGAFTTGPQTIEPPATPTTANALVIQDTGTGRTSGQLLEIFDHLGNPIMGVGSAGGPKVFGDFSQAGAGVFGPFVALDGVNGCLAFDTTAVNHATSRIFMVSGAPAAGLGSNGDVALRIDTPGTSLQRYYVKSAGAWTGIL